ncbi:response regulator [Scytonema sp. NUACC21]
MSDKFIYGKHRLFNENDDNSLDLEEDLPKQKVTDCWKVMIVDDDIYVHQATQLALEDFTFEEKPLNLISAYSAAEAQQLIQDNPDTAFILLDVVMETHDAGLKVVQYIREVLKNQTVRIILRTAQPGQAPETSVILNYDINDYKTKLELTQQKLITTTIIALRSYRQLLQAQQPQSSKTQRNVLVVDDNPADLRLLIKTLSDSGYKVRPTQCGNLAVRSAQSFPPDLILLDINLKDQNGYTVCQQLKSVRATRDIPILFISASNAIVDKVKAFEVGAIDYITKPFQPEEIIARVETHLTNQRLKQQLEEQNRRLQQEIQIRTAAEERLLIVERAIAATSDGIAITTGAPDYALLYVNSGFERITGYCAAEVIGRNCRFLQGAQTDQPALVELRQALADGRDCQVVLQNFRKDGTGFWNELKISPVYDAKGNLKNFIGVQTDISERLATEKALKTSEERWELVLQGTRDGIFDWNLVTGETFASARLQEMLGYEEHSLPWSYEMWCSLVHPEDVARVKIALESHLQRQNSQYAVEYRLRCKDGSYKWILVRGQALWDDNGQPTRMVGTHQDISDRKRTEEELALAKEAAVQASKAKSTFLANMSHELRTPLNAILGFSQLILQAPNLSAEQKENVGIIHSSGEHLLALINQILDFSKIEAGRVTLESKNIDIIHLINEVEHLFRLKAKEKGLQLIIDCNADVPRYICTDEIKLRQVLINLLSNAIKFTDKGSVKLSVELTSTLEKILNTTYFLVFSITDTGIGIASNQIDNLFQPFVQISSGQKSHEGTGLGLSISRQFVQLMGGDMTVESEIERGTTFKFRLPINVDLEANKPKTQQLSRRAIAIEPSHPPYRLLIVDDIDYNRQLLIQILAPLGFELKQASNGQQAIEIWEDWQPHLIWMDLRMPVLDGYEATRYIRAKSYGLQSAIVALTASTLQDTETATLAMGFNAFIRKPLSEEIILNTLHQHLGVHYIYEQTTSDTTEPMKLAEMPKLQLQWVNDMKQAINCADLEVMDSLIAQINSENPYFAQLLQGYLNNFEYKKIINIITQFVTQGE